jgi:magnesium transporter
MAQQKKNRKRRPARPPAGSPPGTLTADPCATPGQAHYFVYDETAIREGDLSEVKDVAGLRTDKGVVWIDTYGVGTPELVQRIGSAFDLHALALEDVMHAHQRPKVEDYPSGYYVVLRMPEVRGDSGLYLEQVSLFLGERYVVTFQEDPGDCFEPLRERLRRGRGRLRTAGADYLAYGLIDSIVDSYFPVLESYGDRLELLEDAVVKKPSTKVISELHAVKRDLVSMRRAIWPMREVLSELQREEHPLITNETRLYLRDCYDHCVQLVELVEGYRDIASGLLDIYLSSVSNRMNEVMKVLTIIATIFIPLSFISGVYGMNFDTDVSPFNMPELHWRFGYFFALGLMLAVALGLLFFFYRKRWI